MTPRVTVERRGSVLHLGLNRPALLRLLSSDDATRGVQAFLERRPAEFQGC